MTPNHYLGEKTMYRPKRLTKKKSRKNFKRGTKIARKNKNPGSRTVRRGGIRL